MTYIDNELENEAIKILKGTEKLYTRTILAEQKKGNIKSEIPVDVLGKYLITLWCGINSLRRVYPDPEILIQQIELQLHNFFSHFFNDHHINRYEFTIKRTKSIY